jgi:type I restriction enzyme, S subunit
LRLGPLDPQKQIVISVQLLAKVLQIARRPLLALLGKPRPYPCRRRLDPTREIGFRVAKYTINADDLYITIAGTIGEAGKVPAILDGQNLTENAAKIVFRDVDRDFLCIVLNADDVQNQFREKTKQMTQPKLALKRIAGARIPIAPFAEQRRIVAKVNQLMTLCDRLEANFTVADATRRRLLNALLAEALAPAERELEAQNKQRLRYCFYSAR